MATATIRTFALETATMVLNTAMSFGASVAISALISGIDYLIHKEEKEAEALENAKSAAEGYKDALNSLQQKTKKTASSANEIAEAYAKLAQGVNTNTNENIHLSNDDYEEFLDLNSQLAELFPSLTKGYDENGNAILGLGGNVETVTEKIAALVEMQERLAKAEIKENLQKYVEGDDDSDGQLKVIEGYSDKYKKAEEKRKQYEQFYKLFNGGKVSSQDLGIGEMDDIFKRAELSQNDYDLIDGYWDISKLSENDLERIKNVFGNVYADLVQSAQNAKTELETANQELSTQMMVWVEDLPTYTESGETFQNAISTMISSIEWDKFGITDYEGAQKLIQQSVLTPISMVADDPDAKAQMTTALSNLLTVDFSKMPVEQAQEAINSYLTAIMNLANDKITDESHKKSLSDMYAMFGMENYENPADRLQANLNSIAGGSTIEMKKLSDYTKDFTLSQQQAWLSATEGAENAKDAIKRYKNSLESSSEASLLSFSEAWGELLITDDDNLKDVTTNLLDLAKAGELTPDTLRSTKEYKALLTKTGLTAEEAAKKINKMVTFEFPHFLTFYHPKASIPNHSNSVSCCDCSFFRKNPFMPERVMESTRSMAYPNA